jgi:type II secretory pathway pseudopilin PulG
MVVVVMMGILASMAVPSFQRAVEQARVDQAALTLRTIWAAQRFHKLDTGHYAEDQTDPPRTAIQILQEAGLLDDVVDSSAFTFTVDPGGFPVHAERLPGPATGSLEIDAEGSITGQVACEGQAIRPSN